MKLMIFFSPFPLFCLGTLDYGLDSKDPAGVARRSSQIGKDKPHKWKEKRTLKNKKNDIPNVPSLDGLVIIGVDIQLSNHFSLRIYKSLK